MILSRFLFCIYRRGLVQFLVYPVTATDTIPLLDDKANSEAGTLPTLTFTTLTLNSSARPLLYLWHPLCSLHPALSRLADVSGSD